MARKHVLSSDDDYSDDGSDAYQPESSSARRPRQVNNARKKNAGPQKLVKKCKRENTASEDDSVIDAVSSSQVPVAPPHPISLHSIADPQPLRDALLAWYAGVQTARGMPWRKPYDSTLNAEQRAQRAYEVWVSEIMLQQTQVATVIPYYNRWINQFPTIRDLADSDIETVNGLWKGLGYYSRARRLLSGAQKAVTEFGGRLPSNARELEAHIPGIGRYSAGAICSIAYGQCVPVLDGNVHRLLSRVLALHALPKAKQTLDILWVAAAALVANCTQPGDLNQALIELGSTVCKVREPACGECPLRPWCQAYRIHKQPEIRAGVKASDEGASNDDAAELPDIEELCMLCEPLPLGSPVTSLPMKVEKKKAREELDVVSVVEWRARPDNERWFLLVRRPEGGLLAGLHEFPTAENIPATISSAAQIRTAHGLLADLLACPVEQGRQHGRNARISEDHNSSPQPADDEGSDEVEVAAARLKQEHGREYGKHEGKEKASALLKATTGAVGIAKVKPAGDVVHVFSHIKKTYRVQWVLLLGGGDEPPALACNGGVEPASASVGRTGPRTKAATRKTKTKTKASNASGTTRSAADSKREKSPSSASVSETVRGAAAWTPMEDVAHANIGTGVVKVWKQVQALWDRDDGSPHAN